DWTGRASADRKNPALWFRGRTHSFMQLLELRGDRSFAAQAALDTRRERYKRCQTQLGRLSDMVLGLDPQIIVIVGDDQHEWFTEAIQPPFAIFGGDEVTSFAMSETEIASHRRSGRPLDPLGYHPSSNVRYPVAASLAKHMVHSAIRDG